MKGTFEYTLRNGSTCRIEADYECVMKNEILDADGWKIQGQEKPTDIGRSSLIAYIDGKKVDSCQDRSFWRLIDAKEGVKKIWGLNIGFARIEDAKRYEEWIGGIIEGGKTEKVKAYEKAEKEKEMKERIESAKSTIAEAERQKDIPCRQEAKKRMKQYNDFFNEGGGGYVPYIICREEYEEALKIVREAESREYGDM